MILSDPQERVRLRRIFSYLFRHRAVFAAGLVCTILFGITETSIPWLMYLLFEPEQASPWIEPDDLPYVLPALLVLVFLVRGALGFIRVYWREWLHHTMSRDIRRDMIDRMVKFPKRYHDEENSGVLIARVMQFVDQMHSYTTSAVITLFQDSARLVGYLATMAVISWRYTLVVLAALLLTVLVIAVISRRIRRFAGLITTAQSELTGSLSDTIQGQTVVKTYGGRVREKDKLSGHLDRVRGASLRQGVALALNQPLSQLLVALALALVFALLARDLVAGTRSEGEVSAFIFAMALVPLPMRNLANLLGQLQQALAASVKVFGLIDAAPEVSGGAHAPAAVRGEIAFEQVSFSYPGGGAPVLDHVDLSVRAGEAVALVGPTGSGKTTVTSLLLGFYRPGSGVVRVDGVDLADWSLDALRAALGVVSQDVVLFDTTVAENVAYPQVGDGIDRNRLRAALRAAQAEGMVDAMPEGERTLLGERGLRLSGGERQRLSIARAFYKDARILVLDEATSSLDSRTEEALKEALGELLQDRTALVIAHRLATVGIVDRILVMDGGRVVASGAHAQLMASSGLYRTLYEAQRLAGGNGTGQGIESAASQ